MGKNPNRRGGKNKSNSSSSSSRNPNPMPQNPNPDPPNPNPDNFTAIMMVYNFRVENNLYPEAREWLDEHEQGFAEADELALFEELCAYIDRMNGNKESSYYHAMRAYNLYTDANNTQQRKVRHASTFLILGERDFLTSEAQGALDKFKLGLELEPENAELLEKKAEVDSYLVDYQKSLKLQSEIIDQEAREEKQRTDKEEERKLRRMEKEKRKREEKSSLVVESSLQQEEEEKDTPTNVDEGEATQESGEKDKKDNTIKIHDSINMVMDPLTLQGKVEPMYGEEFAVTYLSFNDDDVQHFNSLQKLCSSYNGLLSVHHLTKNPDNEFYLLVVEEVMTFDDYCSELETKFCEISRDPKPSSWWPFLEDAFFLIFREVIETLLFLYLEKFRSCGKLNGHLYVTRDGHAKILPCMGKWGGLENNKKATDLTAMMNYMKNLLFFPFRDDGVGVHDVADQSFSFPENLISFFKFVSTHKTLPVEYLLKHPFSWTLEKRVYYPNFVKKALFRTPPNRRSRMIQLNSVLGRGLFYKWSTKLEGHALLKAIWKKGDPSITLTQEERNLMVGAHLLQVSPYNDEVSIIRFFDAAFDHANDSKYSPWRTKDIMTPADIDKELLGVFPDFYITIYEAIGSGVANRDIDEGLLVELYGENKGC